MNAIIYQVQFQIFSDASFSDTDLEHLARENQNPAGKVKKMRFLVLVLCLGTLLLYGRAIAGLWSFIIEEPRPWMLFSGLFGGTLSGGVAILLWKSRLKELEWIKDPEENGKHLS